MYRIFLLLCLAYGLNTSLNAQSISNRAALSTDFVFTLTNNPFVVTNQQILKRAIALGVDEDTSGGGYGYESYHLEFTTSNPGLITKERLLGFTYYFTFYDANDKLLLRKGVDLKAVDSSNSIVGETYFYSLDLIDLPLTLFDITKRIDISVR